MASQRLALRKSERIFSPSSVFWQVNSEWLAGLAGPRALLMQLAHPLVAAGVVEHSSFRQHGLARLYRTVRAADDLLFGSAERARRAARAIDRCHAGVRGTLATHTGSFTAGSHYDAQDPELKLWVLATVIDSTILVHDLFIRPLSPAERTSYYRDSRRLAGMLGIPQDVMPASYEGFTAYVASMLASDKLAVGDNGRTLATSLFGQGLTGSLTRAASFVGIGLLPARLRNAYGFPWDDKREQRLHRLAGLSRRIRRRLPNLICASPRAVIAGWRSREQHG